MESLNCLATVGLFCRGEIYSDKKLADYVTQTCARVILDSNGGNQKFILIALKLDDARATAYMVKTRLLQKRCFYWV